MQRWRNGERQRDVDDALQWADDVLQFDVLHLLVTEPRHDQMMLGRDKGWAGGFRSLFCLLLLFLPFRLRFDLTPNLSLERGFAVFRHACSENSCSVDGCMVSIHHVSAARQCRPAEAELLEPGAELLVVAATCDVMEGELQRLGDPPVLGEVG